MEPGLFQISLKLFVVRGGDFLVLRERETGRGDLPGGRLAPSEFYEDWQRSIAREVLEELGPDVRLRVEPDPLFVFPHFILSAGRDALGVAYRADFEGGEIRLSDEHDAYRWEPIGGYDPGGFFSEHVARAVRRFQQELRRPTRGS